MRLLVGAIAILIIGALVVFGLNVFDGDEDNDSVNDSIASPTIVVASPTVDGEASPTVN